MRGVYPKNVDKELVEPMAAAGCTQISLGFERGSEATHLLQSPFDIHEPNPYFFQ